MKRLSLILFFFFVLYVPLKGQDFSHEKKEIDKEVSNYIEKGMYINASDLLLNFALNLEEYGDTILAFDYFVRSGNLVDEHIEEMLKKGFSAEEYVNVWFQVFISAMEHGYDYNILRKFFSILRFLDKQDPPSIPDYMCSSFIRYQIITCNDSLINDSIRFYSQKALDIIKAQPRTEQSVRNHLNIYKDYYTNRTLNEYKNGILLHDCQDEITKWYLDNKDFIRSLDPQKYKREIQEYGKEYVQQLKCLASSIVAQNGDMLGGINYYQKALDVLSDTVFASNSLIVEMAYCYAAIAQCYSLLNLLDQSKTYSDSASAMLLNNPYLINFESLQTLIIIAENYYRIRNYDLAKSLYQRIIEIKNANGIDVTLSDQSTFLNYTNKVNPIATIQYKDEIDFRKHDDVCGLYSCSKEIADAFIHLIKFDSRYSDSAAYYLTMSDSLLSECENVRKDEVGSFSIYSFSNPQVIQYNLWSHYYTETGEVDDAYRYVKKAVEEGDNNYSSIALFSSKFNDYGIIHKYLPYYFQKREFEMVSMLPILGSLESDTYLQNGESDIYYFPEWASWNPTDSVSVSIAYDAALLIKGLTLRYNTISPYLENHPNLASTKLELDRMRDSIYSITDENTRLLALHRYELKEREILKDVNAELTNVHWKDIANELKNDEACIEFVKYTANAYSWCDSIPKPHYSAMILLPNGKAPVFVDLFDEDELMDVYNLQPKSYDIEMGQILYSKIWGKLQSYIDGKRKVFFSPMGLLNLINIELLIDSTGRTAMDRFNLYRVSSTRNIQTKGTGNVVVSSVASFGGVDYENANEYAEVIQNINTRGNWSYLQNSLSEVNQIESLLQQREIPVVTYTGSNATEDAFKHLDGTISNVIHIASHGYYIPQSQRNSLPYFSNSENTAFIQDELFYSGLILSGGQKAWVDSTFKPDNNDGILTAYEISKLDLHNVDLVVLSACETGLGDNLFDGIFGLQRAFKKAGVKSILMSLWQVDDKATSEYMTFFYEKLINGYSTHDAYISTVLMMKEKYQNANYWASFVLLD